MKDNSLNKYNLCIIGLGYVGLPLCVEFGKIFTTIGYDKSKTRVKNLSENIDTNGEIKKNELKSSKFLKFTNDFQDAQNCNVFIITVPTPIKKSKQPDMSFVIDASKTVGKILKKGDLVIYESTVFPGATEGVCKPILEKFSGLRLNKDYFLGYSPERINPGDKKHTLKNIVKIVSGSNQKITKQIKKIYEQIIDAKVYDVKTIKIAEAAKVIENIQRDVNIALINEFAMLFDKMNLDTASILNAASTKWNFLNFKPGLVGGHCIGVDPYYLTYSASLCNYHPELILAGRRINDNMGRYAAQKIIKLMSLNKINTLKANILVMGLTFKENCSDTRNTRVYDIIDELLSVGAKVNVFDPWVNSIDEEYYRKISLLSLKEIKTKKYECIIIATGHDYFKKMGIIKIKEMGKPNHIIFDIKNIFNLQHQRFRL